MKIKLLGQTGRLGYIAKIELDGQKEIIIEDSEIIGKTTLKIALGAMGARAREEHEDELISIFSEYANTPIEEREVQFTLQDAIDYLQHPIGKGHEIHEKAVTLTVKTLEYVLEIIDNTYRCQDDVYALTDEDAMEELREYFKKHQPEKELEEE